MSIIDNGTTAYQIVTPGRSFPVENEAARVLRQALLKITGVRLPIRWGDRRITRIPTIWVGQKVTEKTGLWDTDSYEIRVEGDDLILGGGFRRGVHYAVSAFLESIGVCYLSPESILYPDLDRIELPKENIASKAAFSYRHVFYPDTEQPEWAVRMKLNVHNGADERWGLNGRGHSFGHSFGGLVPTTQYFQDHPEYYSLVDGHRREHVTQLCCTNPEVADVVCENIKKRMDENPQQTIFAVGQNDWHNWCECSECAAVDKREGTQMGQVLTLVNRVAERFPDKLIATLAYAWSVEPPKELKAADNALIVLCHNEGCFSHGLDQCEVNEPFLNRLKGWKEKAENILIWDYYVNYRHYLLPTANFRRLQNDIRLYRDLGIRNMFCQNSACTGGQFEHLRQYVESKLLWNPDLQVTDLIAQWCSGMFGKDAGDKIHEYIEMLEDLQVSENIHRPSFSMSRVYELYTPEVLKKGKELWDVAEDLAGTSKQKANVFAARSAEMASRLVHTEGEYRLEGKSLKCFPPVDGKLVDVFTDSCLEANVSYLREDTGSPEDFRRDFGRTYDASVLENRKLKITVLPEMGGRIYSAVLKETGQELLAVPNIFQSINCAPYSDGYDFSLKPERLGPGAVEEYFPVFSDRDCTVFEARAENGISIHTEMRLAENIISVKHTAANRTDKAVVIEPVCNPAWNRELFDDNSIIKTDIETVLNPDARTARDIFFREGDCPPGKWEIVSGKTGISVQGEFNPEEVAYTRVLMSGWFVQTQHCFKRKELAPGETAEYTSSWTIS